MAIIKYKDKDGILQPLGATGDHSHSLESLGAAAKDHLHDVATAEKDGFMSKDDKVAIADLNDTVFGNNTNNVTGLVDLVGEGVVAERIAAAVVNKVDKAGSKVLSTNDYTDDDKTKLEGIAEGAEVNQNAFSKVIIGESTIAAKNKTDSITFAAGNNITLTPNVTDGKVTISATDTTYSEATNETAGLMSKDDKTKLDGIAAGATKVTVDSSLSTSSSNAIQNKAVKTAIDTLSTIVGEGSVAERISASKNDCITGLSANGRTITYTKGNGDIGTITTQDTDTTSFTITAGATDDGVIVLSGTNGTNGVTYSAIHAKEGPSSGYNSSNTATSISGFGGSGTIKIPQITVDTYGHVTKAADEEVKITMPSTPTVDSSLSTSSSNAVQNKAVATAIDNLKDLVGEDNVPELISEIQAQLETKLPHKLVSSVDFNTLKDPGFYTVYASNNKPVSDKTYYSLIVTKSYSSDVGGHQIAIPFTGSDIYIRAFYQNSWYQWKKISLSDHTHSYAGSSTAGGAATSAEALTTKSKGSTTQPVYFDANGKPAACTYSLNKTVPSSAVFTDTTYGNATTSAAGLMSKDDKTKLDGIAAGATKVTVDSSLSTSSSNAIQNKAVKTAIDTLSAIVGEGSVAERISASKNDCITGLSASGRTITYTKGNGSTGTITTQDTNTTYSLPTASSTTLGGIKVGSGLSINNGVLSATGGGVNSANPTFTGYLSLNSSGTPATYASTLGYLNQASGTCAHASGNATVASGYASVTEGVDTVALGHSSSAIGQKTTAYGDQSHAEGKSSQSAYKDHSLTSVSAGQGVYNIWNSNFNTSAAFSAAAGTASHVEGMDCLAWGDYSHAEGLSNKAEGVASHAEGQYNKIDGACSHVEGARNQAQGNCQHVQGHFNSAKNGCSNLVSQDGTAFIIGNGTSSTATSNAFRVDYNGTVYSKSTYMSTGADYAEYFEWQDFNSGSEDRRGYFVTLDGEQIKIAEPDDYILGIISGQPAVIGNGDEDWMGRYILDEFGAFIPEEFEYEEEIHETVIDEETGEARVVTKTVTKTGTKYKENPDYDSSRPYIQRADRPEWDAVGMMGVLSVRDDGTCQVNGYCKVAEGGIATASDSGYRVMKRINDHIVKVVFR